MVKPKMEILYRKDKTQLFDKLWGQFLKEKDAPWSYTLETLEYLRTYSKYLVEDLTFLVLRNKKPIALVPLFLEKVDSCHQFSVSGSFIKAPFIAPVSDKKKVERQIFELIDDLAKKCTVSKIMMTMDTADWLSGRDKHNFLQEYGFLDCSISTRLVNLTKNTDELFADMKKHYKQAVKYFGDDFQIVTIDNMNQDFPIHENYRKLHHKASGMVTRSTETFNLQFEMLKKGDAVLFGLKHKDNFVCFSYFFHDNNLAYYASGADDPDFKLKRGLYHVLVWEAIKYYKKKEFDYLEVGWQQFGVQLFDYPTPKDVSISFFKRGFGGFDVPLFRGIKYYDSAVLEAEVKFFLSKAIEVI